MEPPPGEHLHVGIMFLQNGDVSLALYTMRSWWEQWDPEQQNTIERVTRFRRGVLNNLETIHALDMRGMQSSQDINFIIRHAQAVNELDVESFDDTTTTQEVVAGLVRSGNAGDASALFSAVVRMDFRQKPEDQLVRENAIYNVIKAADRMNPTQEQRNVMADYLEQI